MRDSVAAAVAILLFILGIIAWRFFTSSIPVEVPSTITVMAVIVVAILALLTYAQLDPHR